MSVFRVIAAAVVAASLAGCASDQARDYGNVTMNTLFGAASNNCKHDKLCVVTISVTGSCTTPGSIKVTPEPVEMNGKQAVVFWKFAQADYKFCADAGDGIYLQPKHRRNFENQGATSSAVGNEESVPDGECRPIYRVFNWNSDKKDYHYFLRFTDPTGNACWLDPWIRNG